MPAPKTMTSPCTASSTPRMTSRVKELRAICAGVAMGMGEKRMRSGYQSGRIETEKQISVTLEGEMRPHVPRCTLPYGRQVGPMIDAPLDAIQQSVWIGGSDHPSGLPFDHRLSPPASGCDQDGGPHRLGFNARRREAVE